MEKPKRGVLTSRGSERRLREAGWLTLQEEPDRPNLRSSHGRPWVPKDESNRASCLTTRPCAACRGGGTS
jgi:hypothetical protein